jgi:CheY-like chemotaxis protein
VDAVTERANILLVDDHPENLVALEAVLSSLDQVLVTAGSGEEALRALLKDDFALILLDAQMPGMDGFETAAQIKARARTKDVPIIFLTAADSDHRHAYRGYSVGGADYITKPFDPWILRAKVQVFVDLWAAGRRLSAQAEILRRQAQGSGASDEVLSELDRRLADLEEAVEQLDAQLGADPALRETSERVRTRTRSLRQVFGTLESGAGVAGATRREFG